MTTNAEFKLARILAIINDTTEPQPAWYRDTSPPAPTEPLADVSNVEAIKHYCAYGYRTDYKRGVAESDWATYLTRFADPLWATTTAAERDAVVQGAGSFDKDVSILLVLGGGVQGTGPFQTPSIFAPWGSNFDMVQAAAWLSAQPGYAGPGGQ